jgi:SAM-dependent methyltransferase
MKTAYKVPLYYETAFSFFNVKRQVNFFEKLFKKYSKRKVKRVLDVACGPSLQLIELAKRGYESVGIDLNKEMLDYLKFKAKKEGLRLETIKADMQNFRLKKKADFAFIMMGSLAARSNKEFLNHLDSVANSLSRGGLYFIQNFQFGCLTDKPIEWTIRKSGITVKVRYSNKLVNMITQTSQEELILEVKDGKKKKKFVHRQKLKRIYPAEFKLLVEKNGKFEFLGWYAGTVDTWYLNKPLEKARDSGTNMVLLRRK